MPKQKELTEEQVIEEIQTLVWGHLCGLCRNDNNDTKETAMEILTNLKKLGYRSPSEIQDRERSRDEAWQSELSKLGLGGAEVKTVAEIIRGVYKEIERRAMERVFEEIEGAFEPTVPMSLDYEKYQALKSKMLKGE